MPCSPLPSDIGGSSAATQQLSQQSPWSSLSARKGEAGACDCPRYSETLPKTDAHCSSTCLGNAGSTGTRASPPPATASDAPRGLQAGAEPQEPSKAHVCHKYPSGFSELEQFQWGNSEPRGNLAPASPGAHGLVMLTGSSSSIPTGLHHCLGIQTPWKPTDRLHCPWLLSSFLPAPRNPLGKHGRRREAFAASSGRNSQHTTKPSCKMPGGKWGQGMLPPGTAPSPEPPSCIH